MPKVVSWDVGIKHLAYCILEDIPDNKEVPYKIHKWENINILEEDMVNPPSCCGKRKNGNDCSNKAKMQFQMDDVIYGVCNTHKKDHPDMVKEYREIEFMENFAQEECEYLSDNEECGKNAKWKKPGGSFYCTKHKNKLMKKRESESNLKKIKKINCKNIDISYVELKMLQILDTLPDILQVDEVLIENQPVYKNPKMKNIASHLKAWFKIRGMVDQERTGSTIKSIKSAPACNKLKVNDDNTVIVLNKAKDDTEKYKLTKKLAIKYSKQLLKNDPDNLKIIEDAEKKDKADDLCDAFLQGVYYLSRKKKKKKKVKSKI